jgi:hypothetical protein
MTSMHFDVPPSEESWFRKAAPAQRDDVADLRRMRRANARRGRRRLVHALGYTMIAVVAASAAWMATNPFARDEIASWGTMGNAAQARLTTTSEEQPTSVEPEVASETSSLMWVQATAPAEPSLETDVVPEPTGLTLAATELAVWRPREFDEDDLGTFVPAARAPDDVVPATGGLDDPY